MTELRNMAEARVIVLRVLSHPVSLSPREVAIASSGVVYTELASHVLEKLEDEGLVHSRPIGRTDSTLPFLRRYSITDAGRVVLSLEDEIEEEPKPTDANAMFVAVITAFAIVASIMLFCAAYFATRGDTPRVVVLVASSVVLLAEVWWARRHL